MADKKVSDFTATTSVAGGDLFEMENAGGNSRKITGANLAAGLRGLQTFRGALVKLTGNLTGKNFAAGYDIQWDAEEYDTDSIHDTVTNNTRLTVPSGVTRVRLGFQLRVANFSGGTAQWAGQAIRKNGADMSPVVQTLVVTNSQHYIQIFTPVVVVTAGDYFEARALCQTDTSVDVQSDASWFSMEIIS